VRRGHGLEGEDVRARPAEDEEGSRVFAEVPAEDGLGALGEGVVAVRDDVPAVVGRRERLHHARVDARVVVAGEAALRFHGE
jgi:hypothetical protein